MQNHPTRQEGAGESPHQTRTLCRRLREFQDEIARLKAKLQQTGEGPKTPGMARKKSGETRVVDVVQEKVVEVEKLVEVEREVEVERIVEVEKGGSYPAWALSESAGKRRNTRASLRRRTLHGLHAVKSFVNGRECVVVRSWMLPPSSPPDLHTSAGCS